MENPCSHPAVDARIAAIATDTYLDLRQVATRILWTSRQSNTIDPTASSESLIIWLCNLHVYLHARRLHVCTSKSVLVAARHEYISLYLTLVLNI